MAIKLKELYKDNPEYGAPLPALSLGKYKYVRQTDIKNKIFNTFVNSGPLLKKDDILISRVGSNAGETYIHDTEEKCVFAGFLVRYHFDDLKLKNKYFYYWTKTSKYKNQVKKMITGSGQPQFNPPVVSELMIFIPKIETQQQIIDIIEPIEKLEKIIIQIINNIEKSFFSRSLNFQDSIKKNIIWKTNGYAYEGYEKINDGLYKIFTIKNIIDDFKFSRTNVLKNNLINIGDLVTGLSGTIGTVGIIFESDWVSNQRTLTLRSNIPLNLKIAIEKQVDFLLKNATGAVQKNITMNDILNLKTIEKKLNDELINKFYIKLLLLKNKIIKIKNCEIKLLIK
ncbi:restriction endonuclease subunit S [Spiroplasma platyhelix]|uniref:restriction endonuclease subunit S n=1 Tax=Spiroplasma platyhelix TaxID=301585 RepID=UPI001F20DD29|nr:restriction endonuclease subunit S [Spiroplasma platyhelix]UJB28794.1 type I restriction enzyme, S subunit [Spiroplasma platyhelix PALS-1]